jgi:leader peptidase (prepilin peptidase)/N-methyltransferase
VDLASPLLLPFAALFGAAAGSFLNVCVYRLPREGLSVVRPRRSFCPACGSEIRWTDNIPILSWLMLGGRCRSCRAPISARYLLVEALTALLFVVIAGRFLLGADPSWGAFAVIILLASALVVASFVDLELRVIPDEITLRGIMLAPFLAILVPELHAADRWIAWLLHGAAARAAPIAAALPGALREGPLLWGAVLAGGAASFALGLHGYAAYWRIAHPREPRGLRHGLLGGVLAGAAGGAAVAGLLRPGILLSPAMFSFWAAMAGMLVGSSVILLVGILGTKVFRRPAMGFGDVKLMGLLGAFTGWVGALEAVFIACLLGSAAGIVILLRTRSRYLPFGPFLAAGALVVILWPEALAAALRWYMDLFR